jgi:pyrrolysine biosynthesis protein PylD
MSEEALHSACDSACIGVIPVTAGQGVIRGFTQAVKGIIDFLNYPCFITESHDASGLAEAVEKGADIVFLADDNRFIAIHLSHQRVVDNSEATGWSYAYALDACTDGLQGREVLLIGAGRVGESALYALKKLGAKVGVFDIDEKKTRFLSSQFKLKQEDDLARALDRYAFIFDASPAADIIHPEHITPETAIAACGIPLGVSEKARPLVEERLIHDPLQLGTAAMLAMAISHGLSDKCGGRIGRIA